MNRIRNPCGPHFIRTTFIHHSTQNQTKHEKKIVIDGPARTAHGERLRTGDGIAGITEATSMVTSYFYPLVQLIYAIGAVTGLIGGIRVYQKFSSGDPDTSKTAASWFGACIFLILVGTVLESFFF